MHDAGTLGRETAWADWLGIGPDEAARIAALPLGHAIAEAEKASPRLAYKPIGPRQLPGQIRLARLGLVPIRILTGLRRNPGRTIPAGTAAERMA